MSTMAGKKDANCVGKLNALHVKQNKPQNLNWNALLSAVYG